MKRREWKKEEDAILRALAPTGVGSRHIAERLNRTRPAVILRASKLQVKIRDPRGGKAYHHARTRLKQERLGQPDAVFARVQPTDVPPEERARREPQRPNAIGSVDWAV